MMLCISIDRFIGKQFGDMGEEYLFASRYTYIMTVLELI